MLLIVNLVLLLILIILVLNLVIQKLRVRWAATLLKEEDFAKEMKHVQLIDLREQSAYARAHLMGARNIPYSIFRDYFPSLRKDRPIYLYDDKEIFSGKAAVILKKAGFNQVCILKRGYSAWNGKVIRKS